MCDDNCSKRYKEEKVSQTKTLNNYWAFLFTYYFNNTLAVMIFLCSDEQFINAEQPIIKADNRGFRYGDGIFETLRCVDSSIPLAPYHFDRLFKGLQTLFFDVPTHYTPEYFTTQIKELCTRNKHNPARVRLTMYRGDGGIKDPQNHFPHYIIQSWPLPYKQWQLNENGLVLGLCTDVQKNCDMLANCKTNNHLPYLYAAHCAQKQKWNDAIILNPFNRVADTTIANIFIVKDKCIYTPPLSEGCIAGVVRRYIIESFSNTFPIQEKLINIKDVVSADEVFTTNAIRGIQWVKSFEEKNYTYTITKHIHTTIMNTFSH